MLNKRQNELPIIMDIEASGFGRNSYPIEIGIAMEDGSTRCFLIYPAHDWQHWDEESEQLHGITREILFEHGRPAEEVCNVLNDLLENKVVYCDGWAHDQTWLHVLFETASIRPKFKIDSVVKLLDENQMMAWSDSKQHILEQCNFQRHRASNDALLLQRTYSFIIENLVPIT